MYYYSLNVQNGEFASADGQFSPFDALFSPVEGRSRVDLGQLRLNLARLPVWGSIDILRFLKNVIFKGVLGSIDTRLRVNGSPTKNVSNNKRPFVDPQTTLRWPPNDHQKGLHWPLNTVKIMNKLGSKYSQNWLF